MKDFLSRFLPLAPGGLRLRTDPQALREHYESAHPFPHIVIDGLFEDRVLKKVLRDFPTPNGIQWRRFDSPTERKLGYQFDRSELSPSLRAFLYEMNSFTMLGFLEMLTGIEGLIPDPYFGGGGAHQIEPGGFLKIHADFNVHPKLKLHRRLNMLVYLNEDWNQEYGGHLELWDAAMTRCVQRILPVFNRTVIFSTTETSFHGHPEPLTCPAGTTRKSISLYYYTSERPLEETAAPHDTLFTKRHDHDW